MKTRLFGVLSFLIVMLLTAGIAVAQDQEHVQMNLTSVGGSGVTGIVNLTAMPNGGGTNINVVAFGLIPGQQYVSLYYDNHTCELEPYSAEDVIGGMYTANGGGVGTTHGTADDDLDEINSVSVRHAGDFTLLACADVHPANPVTGVDVINQPSGSVSGNSNAIMGTALLGPDDQFYKVEIKGGPFTDFTTIGQTHTGSVTNGTLETMGALLPGDYLLRLVVVGKDSNFTHVSPLIPITAS